MTTRHHGGAHYSKLNVIADKLWVTENEIGTSGLPRVRKSGHSGIRLAVFGGSVHQMMCFRKKSPQDGLAESVLADHGRDCQREVGSRNHV